MYQNTVFDLESLIDKCGLESVMNQLAEIASQKAAHIESTYLDSGLAEDWSRASSTLADAGESLPENVR